MDKWMDGWFLSIRSAWSQLMNRSSNVTDSHVHHSFLCGWCAAPLSPVIFRGRGDLAAVFKTKRASAQADSVLTRYIDSEETTPRICGTVRKVTYFVKIALSVAKCLFFKASREIKGLFRLQVCCWIPNSSSSSASHQPTQRSLSPVHVLFEIQCQASQRRLQRRV